MVARDHKLKRPGEGLPAFAGFYRARCRMLKARAAVEIPLELRRILAEIVQQTGGVPPLAGAELGRALAREGGHLKRCSCRGCQSARSGRLVEWA